MSNLNILFLVNEKKDYNLEISKDIIAFLKSKGIHVFIEQELKSRLNEVDVFTEQKIDFAIIVGGDGTILNFAHTYKNNDLRFLGINLGRVGALADATLENYKEKICSIIEGKYYIEDRNVMNCKIYDGEKLSHEMVAFNEVLIHRASLYKMLLINMTINGHNKTSFYADGIIASTATGSSAYSLSCGGPLLLPTAKNFVLTPIAPQLRVITSLVINDTDEVVIDLVDQRKREEYGEFFPTLFIDGAFRFDFNENSKLVLTKSNRILKIVKTDNEISLFEPIYKVSTSNSDLFTSKKD